MQRTKVYLLVVFVVMILSGCAKEIEKAQPMQSDSQLEVTKKNNIELLSIADEIVVEKSDSKGVIYNKTIKNTKNIENIINHLNELTYSTYEQAQCFDKMLYIWIKSEKGNTRYAVYDYKWLIKDDGYAKKLLGDGAKALIALIDTAENDNTENEKIGLKDQTIQVSDDLYDIRCLTDDDFKKINKNMTYREMMTVLGYGNYTENNYQKSYSCHVSITDFSAESSSNASKKTINTQLKFYFDNLDEKTELGWSEIISKVSKGQYAFYSKNTVREIPCRYYFDGELVVYSTVLESGREVERLYDKNRRSVLKGDFKDIYVYDKDCITATYSTTTQDGSEITGLFNSKGESVLNFDCNHIYFSKDIKTGELTGTVGYNNGQNCILIDKNGKKLTETIYDSLFFNPDNTMVAQKNNENFIIDRYGNILAKGRSYQYISKVKNGIFNSYYILDESKFNEFTEMIDKIKNGAISEDLPYNIQIAVQENYTYAFNGEYVYLKNKLKGNIIDTSRGYSRKDKIFTSSVNIEEKISRWLEENKKHVFTTQIDLK